MNRPLNPLDIPPTDRKTNHTQAGLFSAIVSENPGADKYIAQDQWFLGLAISGGGSRSANFSAAIMFELQRLGLLHRLDAISAVSGGSLSAACYCLSDDKEFTPKAIQQKLTHPFASDMLGTLFQPWTLGAMWLTDYDRTDVMAQTFDRALFSRHGKSLTYADLRPDRPRLLLNATDMQSGRRFVFCNESFDEINSDLASYPIAYAAAASASVPVVFHHVTLQDYSTIFKQYRHFVDGGIVDNLGVQTLLESYQQSNDQAKARQRPIPYSRGAVFIIVDAGTQFNARLSDRADVGLIESLGTGARLSTGALLKRASSATMTDLIVKYARADMTAEDIRKAQQQLEQTGYLEGHDRDGRPLVLIHIALSQAAGLKNAPHQGFSQSLDAIDTYFNISPTEAHNLYLAARLIVQERFEEQLQEIGRRVGQKP